MFLSHVDLYLSLKSMKISSVRIKIIIKFKNKNKLSIRLFVED